MARGDGDDGGWRAAHRAARAHARLSAPPPLPDGSARARSLCARLNGEGGWAAPVGGGGRRAPAAAVARAAGGACGALIQSPPVARVASHHCGGGRRSRHRWGASPLAPSGVWEGGRGEAFCVPRQVALGGPLGPGVLFESRSDGVAPAAHRLTPRAKGAYVVPPADRGAAPCVAPYVTALAAHHWTSGTLNPATAGAACCARGGHTASAVGWPRSGARPARGVAPPGRVWWRAKAAPAAKTQHLPTPLRCTRCDTRAARRRAVERGSVGGRRGG